MLGEIFGPDLIIVLVVLVVLMFGGPRLARNLGQAKKEFEKSVKTSDKATDKPAESADETTEN